MAENIILDGDVYTGIQNVVLPVDGGGTATFSEATSGAATLHLLETKTAASGDTYLRFDWQSEWSNYAAFVIGVENLEQTPSAYMRLGINTTSTVDGYGFYINGSTKFTTKSDFSVFVPLAAINGTVYFTDSAGTSTSAKQVGTVINMSSGYIRITPVSATFVSGTFKLYGLK